MGRRRFLVILLLALAVLSLLGSVLSRGTGTSEQAPVLTGPVRRESFTVVVRTVGELDAARSTVVCSEVRGDRGKIIQVIREGARVEQDDILVRLDPTPFEEKVAQLTAKVEEGQAIVDAQEQAFELEKNQAHKEVKIAEFESRSAELDLLKLEKGDGPLEMARLEGSAQEAKKDYEEKTGYLGDLRGLEQRGFVNPGEIAQAEREIEEARRAHEIADLQYESYRDYVLPFSIEKTKAQVARARANIEETKKGSGYKVGKAFAALQQAEQTLRTVESSLKSAQAELERTVIRAPIPGMVVLQESFRAGQQRKPRVGDTVWQNQPLMYLPDVSEMIVKTQVREVDLHKIAVGKPAFVFVDAYPDLRLTGEVASVGVLAESQAGTRGADKCFQIVVSISDEDQRLRPGMTARVEIRCAEVRQALSVPIQAVFSEEGRKYCFVSEKGCFARRDVTTGLQNEDWMQVTGGIREGEQVALSHPPSDQIQERRSPSERGQTQP